MWKKKLSCITRLEERFATFEKDIKCMCLALETRIKGVEQRVERLEHASEGAGIAVADVTSRVEHLEKERDNFRDDMTYLKSQSMRNNLIFTGVPEVAGETPEVTESTLRKHIHEALKIAKDAADRMQFERVHRSPGQPTPGKTRSIVAKFAFFKDREAVRRQWKELNGSNFNVFEQFPPEVVATRRRLVPKMKEARGQGKRSWIAYDTLYVDGRPVKE